MKFVQRSLHEIRKRAWKHKKALFHMNKAITEMELVYNHASHSYRMLLYSIDEMKGFRAQEYFEFLKKTKEGPHMPAIIQKKTKESSTNYLKGILKSKDQRDN